MTFSKFALTVAVCLTAVSCSTPSGDHVAAKKYVLDHKKRITAADPAIRFEQRHRLFGAVSTAEMEALDGVYYTTRWSLADGSQPAKLKFYYRQANSGSKVMTKEVDVSGESGRYEFSVTGDEAKKNPVTSWKIALERGKQELAVFKSYMWE